MTELSTDLVCRTLLHKKFFEDVFCVGHLRKNTDECQVTFLISFAHKLSLCSLSLCLCNFSSFMSVYILQTDLELRE